MTPKAIPGTVVLTRSMVDALRTNGSFTTATIRALGIQPGQQTRGWAQNLIGQQIPSCRYEAALDGVGKYSKTTLKIMRKAGRPLPAGCTCPTCGHQF